MKTYPMNNPSVMQEMQSFKQLLCDILDRFGRKFVLDINQAS
tara:strand:- start:1050 stop:1175 length:126 start_codon:yes stop_codon:yes gene_type:complete